MSHTSITARPATSRIPFQWLRDRDDPDTVAYLEAENDYANAWFDERKELVDELFEEIKSRVQETDISAPIPVDDWWYVSRTEEGPSYPIHCRGRSAASAADDLLLDENAEAGNHDFFELGAFEISPDHRLLAWSADIDGHEHYTLRVRDLTDHTELPDEVPDTTAWAGVAWSADCTLLYYVVADAQERPYRGDAPPARHRARRRRRGLPRRRRPVLRPHRHHPQQGLDRHPLAEQRDVGELAAADRRPGGDAVPRARQRDGVEYDVDHWGDRFVILTNEDAEDFRVMEATVAEPSEWSELIAHEPGRRITSVEPFADFLALHEWQAAQPRIRVIGRDGHEAALAVDAEPHNIDFGPNAQWDTSVLRLTRSRSRRPPVLDVDVATGDIDVVKQTPTPNVDLDSYVAERMWATAPDGQQVPIDVVRHVDTPVDGSAPCCVYGYGSYEASMPPWFSVARLSWLDRGGTWALVHPRGGGELGRAWYLDGKLLAKRNTFTDTLAACAHLVDTGVADRDRRRSAAAAPAACSSALASRWSPSSSRRPSPRSRSSTS